MHVWPNVSPKHSCVGVRAACCLTVIEKKASNWDGLWTQNLTNTALEVTNAIFAIFFNIVCDVQQKVAAKNAVKIEADG